MKINTDGVLLGAMAGDENPQTILDIGTGTGVIALMLAQRFPYAAIEAVEIDLPAARTAEQNFRESPFKDRLSIYHGSFQEYSAKFPSKKYDLIVSNPPFFIGSLKNPDRQKEVARHATDLFFEDFTDFAVKHLRPTGTLVLILPPETASTVMDNAGRYGLRLQHQLDIQSFHNQKPHRLLITLGAEEKHTVYSTFAIYQQQKQYSEQYRTLLQDFLTIF